MYSRFHSTNFVIFLLLGFDLQVVQRVDGKVEVDKFGKITHVDPSLAEILFLDQSFIGNDIFRIIKLDEELSSSYSSGFSTPIDHKLKSSSYHENRRKGRVSKTKSSKNLNNLIFEKTLLK